MHHLKIVCFLFVMALANVVFAGEVEKADALFDEGKYSQALQIYLKPELQTDPRVQTRIGWIYGYAKEARNDAKSFDWFKKSAEQGYAAGQYNLGVAYEDGKGVKQDYGQAMSWYQKAAGQELPGAYTAMGILYENGKGVKENWPQAARMYIKAAEKGEGAAQCNLAAMLTFGKGVKKSYAKAEQLLKTCLKNDANNTCCLDRTADMYRKGWGVKQDNTIANEYHSRSAALGSGFAMYNLGTAYDYGFGVDKNAQIALDWYNRGAAAGDARSMYRLYEVYEYGKLGQSVDKAKAKAWLDKAEPAMKKQNVTRDKMKDQYRLLLEESESLS